ncbi:MAG: gfo/Idh/MocA family oxidoreductase [Candidatus Omnitrophota bacterium]|jgi:predicted dehydrogenase|nr:MAG: gfo/Idh/MocA family oxidoreductase [Candidatus Omnitrophota bacterium]
MQLTQEQQMIGRRNFLKAAAVIPPAAAFAYTATNAGPVKAGVVGTGMEGRVLMSVANPKYLYLVAACDIRPDNRELGRKLIQDSGHHPNPKAYEKYEDMLNDPEIEAVIVATPLHLHGPMTMQALEAGKHVFTEKTMAYTTEECVQMTLLARQKGLNLQIGHQRFYNPLYWDAYRMYKEGLLGNVYHIRALWHRNTDWNYWIHVVPEYREQLMKFDPSPFGYPDLPRMVNWRWYSPTSHGMWTELCSHQIAITNWFFGDKGPKAVQASSGHYKVQKDFDQIFKTTPPEQRVWEVDDREVDDHIYAIYEYDEGRTVTYSAIQSNRFDDYYEEIMGTRGTIILTKENESYLFWEAGWDEKSAKEAAKETQVGMSEEDKAGAAFAAHDTGAAATGGGGAGGFTNYEPYGWELEGFAHTIRTGAPNLCSGVRGTLAAQACYAAQEAAAKKQRIEIPVLNI